MLAVAKMTGLRRLNLSETWVGDRGVVELAPLKSLEAILLAPRVTPEGLGRTWQTFRCSRTFT